MTWVWVGIFVGMCLPLQTCMNTRLRVYLGSPYRASFVSFLVGTLFLVVVLAGTATHDSLSWTLLRQTPAWMWLGGICGVVFLTANIVLLAKIGSVQTVVFPVLGQILMGLAIDHFGFFRVSETPMTIARSCGAVAVILGVLTVTSTLAKHHVSTSGAQTDSVTLWGWRLAAVGAGMLSASQTAINASFGLVLHSPLAASFLSFSVGTVCLAVLCAMLQWRAGEREAETKIRRGHAVWWMWLGGILGGSFVFSNAFLAPQIGTGLTIIAQLLGATVGSLVIDHFGFFGVERRPIRLTTVWGVGLMLAGVATIELG